MELIGYLIHGLNYVEFPRILNSLIPTRNP